MNKEETIKRSRFLSLVLRHKPEEIGIILDENGWVDVSELLEKISKKGINLDLEKLKYIVENNDKKRFAFSEDQTKIRANQGHSVKIELDYEPTEPPEYLYHGTATRNLDVILDKGLQKQKRHHVHLSKDTETAINVGKRHGTPVVLKIRSGEMWQKGTKFYLSDNDVWLVDQVLPEFIETY